MTWSNDPFSNLRQTLDDLLEALQALAEEDAAAAAQRAEQMTAAATFAANMTRTPRSNENG